MSSNRHTIHYLEQWESRGPVAGEIVRKVLRDRWMHMTPGFCTSVAAGINEALAKLPDVERSNFEKAFAKIYQSNKSDLFARVPPLLRYRHGPVQMAWETWIARANILGDETC